MSDQPDGNKMTEMQKVYANLLAEEYGWADEIAAMNRDHMLRRAAIAKDPEERRLLLRLSEMKLIGARDHWRVDAARREGTLAELVAKIEGEQEE